MNVPTDQHIIQRVRGGDTHAFRYLVEKYQEVSLALAYSVVKDTALAEDMLQEAFGAEVVAHYTRCAEWEQEEFDRAVTDWEIARGFERA